MDAIAVDEPTGSFRPRSGNAIIGTGSVLSAAAFLWMRAGSNMPPPQFQGVCDRLHEAGLAIVPQDVFCLPVTWTSRAAYVVASLLVAVGFVLSGVILAASGRRLTAFLPLLAALAVKYPQDVLFPTRLWGSTSWPRGPVLSTAATMVVMALPVGAVIYAKWGSRVRHARSSLIPGIAATVLCGGGVAGTVFVAQSLLTRHIGDSGYVVGIAGIAPEAIAIAVFGALLGPDRRWWPWSLVPLAILLSGGPSDALIVGPEHVLNWSQFGVVVPLFAAGLIGSAWVPLAAGLARLFPDEEEAWESPPEGRSEPPPIASGRIRPVVVLNAFAAGLLVVALIVFRADPSPVQWATTLPYYLGERISVQDLRTKLDLRLAMTTIDAYRASHGTYIGFDAASGAAADPSLQWIDGMPSQPFGEPEHTIVAIVSANDTQARIVAVSGSSNGFCLQRTSDGLSYGRASRLGASDPGVNVIEEAVAVCGSTPWSADAVHRFPIATMCVDVEPDRYLMCRVVQALMMKTMQRT